MPVPEVGDSFRDKLRCRLALAHVRFFHVLILEVLAMFLQVVMHLDVEKGNALVYLGCCEASRLRRRKVSQNRAAEIRSRITGLLKIIATSLHQCA